MVIRDDFANQDYVYYISFIRLQLFSLILLLFKALCNSITCLNGGTCLTLSSGTGWACNCQSGFTGDRCQESISSESLNRLRNDL